jgi:hypothetical protein
MKPLEILYLCLGVGIIVHGVITQTLTMTSLGAGMFFIGLVPVSRKDRNAQGTGDVREAVIKWLTKGGPGDPPTR